jgi:hypothetical protein
VTDQPVQIRVLGPAEAVAATVERLGASCPAERAKRAQFAMRAYMATLSRRRVLTRRRRQSEEQADD